MYLRAAASVLALSLTTGVHAATIVARTCSLADVQAAVSAASDGDIVAIPNGTCAWAGGLSTTKQVRIQAQNYTPTKGGTMTRSVVITNNSTSDPLISLTSGNSHHVGVAGIRFNEGSGDQNHIRLNGTGSKVALISDCAFEVKNRFGNQPDIAALAVLSLGGVIWNSYFNGVGGGLGGQCCPEGASILVKSPRGWYTPSTMGRLDSNGAVNIYLEDSTLKNFGQAPDVDDNGRFVMRYSLLDGVSGLTHGFTSSTGGRHAEYYNNRFNTTTDNRNIAGRYFWLRAGTVVFTDNDVQNPYRGYGTPTLLTIGDNTSPAGYPQSRQPGWGHDGTRDVIDPVYIWNNTGPGAYSWGIQGGWETNVKLNREIYVNSGAKPGWAKFTYPHPARTDVGAQLQPNPPTGVVVE